MFILHLLRQAHCHAGQQKNGRDAFAKTKPSPSYTKPKKADQRSLKKMVEKCQYQSSSTDRLMKAKALVEDPDRLISEITAILESKQAHPLLDQMVNPNVRDGHTSPQPLHREDSAPHEEPHKQKYHKIGFSSAMLAVGITNVGDPRLIIPVIAQAP